MSTKQLAIRTENQPEASPSITQRIAKFGRGVAMAGLLAAAGLTAIPMAAQAHGSGNGAAIGLGILGSVIAGAAIAATTPPVYAAPPTYYGYPQQGYYYNAALNHYYSPYSYYGSAPYGYPGYDYQ